MRSPMSFSSSFGVSSTLVISLFCSGCGGGGGSDNSSFVSSSGGGEGSGTPPSQIIVMPGLRLGAEEVPSTVPGSRAFRFTTDGSSMVNNLTIMSGTDWETSTSIMLEKQADASWLASMPDGNPSLFVHVTLTDGNILEAAIPLSQ